MLNTDAKLLIARLFPGQEADPIVVRLIDALGGHPLLISLMIERLKRYPSSRRSEVAEHLLQRMMQADPAPEHE